MTELNQIPQPPSKLTGLVQWASQVTAYLTRQASANTKPVEAQIVQLRHKLPGDGAKATKDGILMWDAATGQVVVSVGGAWKTIDYTP